MVTICTRSASLSKRSKASSPWASALRLALQAFGLQQLGQVQQVGQTPLAIHQGQQALGHLLLIQPGAEGAHKALLLPELMIALGGFALAVPGLGILAAGGEISGAAAQQTAGQSITQSTLPARVGGGGG